MILKHNCDESIYDLRPISDSTVAKELQLSSAQTFAKCFHQSAAIGLGIKPPACGRVRHVPDVGLGAEPPPGRCLFSG